MPGRFIFNLGQNMVGWAKLNIPVEKDQTTVLRFAEMLNTDGTIHTKNYRDAKSTDSYTAATSGTIQWEPKFTFHGFRFVELSGLPSDVKPEKDWVTGVVLHSDLTKIGTFESSHERWNQLHTSRGASEVISSTSRRIVRSVTSGRDGRATPKHSIRRRCAIATAVRFGKAGSVRCVTIN